MLRECTTLLVALSKLSNSNLTLESKLGETCEKLRETAVQR